MGSQATQTTNLTVRNLTKRFGSRIIVQNCSHVFSIGTFGIVGPNGIGKSTFLSLITGMLAPDSGEIIINGMNTRNHPLLAKTKMSCAPGADALYPFMTGGELLHLVAAARCIQDESYMLTVIDGFWLSSFTGIPFKELSEGTRHKFALTAALISRSDILVLDEPTNALDDSSISFLRDQIRSRTANAITIIATHDKPFLDSVGAVQIEASSLLNT